jgi:hypothetical protein
VRPPWQQQQQRVLLDQVLLLLLHSSAVGLLVTVTQQIPCRRCRAVRHLLLLLLEQALSSPTLTL